MARPSGNLQRTGVTGHTLTRTVSDLLRSRKPFHYWDGGADRGQALPHRQWFCKVASGLKTQPSETPSQTRLEYERRASGMKIAATVAHPSNAHPTWDVKVPSFIRSRRAETTWETGLTEVRVWSHPGRVLTGTNALDRNARGNMI